MSSLARLQLGLRKRLGVEAGDLGFGGFGGVHGGDALGEHFNAEGSGVVVGQIEAAADGVGQPQLRADLLKEPAAETAAENFVHDDDGGHVGIVAIDAEGHDLHVGLIHVFLVDEVGAGLGPANSSWRGGSGVTGGRGSKAARTLASMAAGSKSPLMPTISLPLSVRSCQA